MKKQERIESAQKRIQQLKTLIDHWLKNERKNEFELYKQGYNDLSKALGKLKIQHQDAKIDVEYLVNRLIPIIERQQEQTHEVVKVMSEVCMSLHKRIEKLERNGKS